MKSTAYLVAGLGFGDEAKGATCDALCRWTGAKLIVRYNGGPQCAHNVVTPEGHHHTFAQFGSGTLADEGVRTYLSQYTLIEPYALFNESFKLESIIGYNPLYRVIVEEGAAIITPFHWMMNQVRELARGKARHGSCGFGIGELRSDETEGRLVIRVRDITDTNRLRATLNTIRDLKMAEAVKLASQTGSGEINTVIKRMAGEDIERVIAHYREFYDRVNVVPDSSLPVILHRFGDSNGSVVFEGAQGMLLDETFGFAPHNTWTDITYTNAKKLLWGVDIPQVKVGALRAYHTRHGAGPFPTEDPNMVFPDHNNTGPWQGNFRFGQFDMILAKYAMDKIGGVDMIALSHLDHANPTSIKYVDSYTTKPGWIQEMGGFATPMLARTVRKIDETDTDMLMASKPSEIKETTLEGLESMLGTPIGILGHGQSATDRRLTPVGLGSFPVLV